MVIKKWEENMKNILITTVSCCLVIIFIVSLFKTEILKDILKTFYAIPKALKIIIYLVTIGGLIMLIRHGAK
jgi:hypothetical protein